MMRSMQFGWRLERLRFRQEPLSGGLIVASLLLVLLVKLGLPYLLTLLPTVATDAMVERNLFVLADLFLLLLIPFLLCFTAAMTMLEELDERVAFSYQVMPAGRAGYLIGRLLIPCGLSAGTVAVVAAFGTLSVWRFWELITLAVLSSLQALLTSLIITTFSHNKLEGMAAAKLSALTMLGLLGPFFFQGTFRYCLMILPSYWLAQGASTHAPGMYLLALAAFALWLAPLWRRLLTGFEMLAR